MSCFAVSKLTGKCGGGNSGGGSANNQIEEEEEDEERHRLLRIAAHHVTRGIPSGMAQTPSKKKSKHHGLSNIEIVQEVSSAPPPSPRQLCPTSPAPPPGTPLLHSRRMDSASVCSMQPPPSPHMGYQHFNNSSYHIGAPVYPNSRSSHCFNVSVPPSPSMSVGCRSPVLQRKVNYSTMEVQSAALSSLKDEVMELSVRLSHVTKERDHLEKSINRMQLDKLRLSKQKDDQMDSMSSRYEERLVELHSVIAELSRQVEEKSRERIAEEDSEEENYTEKNNTENESRQKDEDVSGRPNSRSEIESRTSTDIDAQAVEAGNRLAAQLGVSMSGASDLCAFLRMTRSSGSRSMAGLGDHLSSTNSLQMMALQEELSDAKERNVQLTARLQQREADLDEARRDLETLAQEKERLRDRVTQLEEQSLMSPALSPTKLNVDFSHADEDLRKSPNSKSSVATPLPRLRMAEKKRIKRINPDDDEEELPPQVTGSDLSSVGVRSSFLAEHLVQDIQDKSSMHEFVQSFISPSSPLMQARNGTRDVAGHNNRRSVFLESKLKEFEIEMERLSSRIEHLKSQNEVLNLTLSESKNHCDNITVLIGKYESNYTAQQLAVTYANHIIESLEVLISLLETELGLVLANCRASLTSSSIDDRALKSTDSLERANDNRFAAEALAKRLLTRLEIVTRPDSGLAMPSGSSNGCSGSGVGVGGLGAAWEDSSGYSQATSSASPSLGSTGAGGGGGANCDLTTSSIGSFIFSSNNQLQTSTTTRDIFHQQQQQPELSIDVSRSDEIRVREYIAYLKSTRNSIQSTVVPDLESLHSVSESSQNDKSPRKQISINEARTADLEMAVLVQELMAMREERADLRAQVYLMEQEKKSLELLINSQKAQEMALKTHIKHLQEELENQESMDDLDSEASFQNRNSELKSRITELLTTLEKVKRNSELRQQQSDELIKDLKTNQRCLTAKLEKTKNKYELRLKRMEQQILQSMLFPTQFGAAAAAATSNGTSTIQDEDDDSEDESEIEGCDQQQLLRSKTHYLNPLVTSRGGIGHLSTE